METPKGVQRTEGEETDRNEARQRSRARPGYELAG